MRPLARVLGRELGYSCVLPHTRPQVPLQGPPTPGRFQPLALAQPGDLLWLVRVGRGNSSRWKLVCLEHLPHGDQAQASLLVPGGCPQQSAAQPGWLG